MAMSALALWLDRQFEERPVAYISTALGLLAAMFGRGLVADALSHGSDLASRGSWREILLAELVFAVLAASAAVLSVHAVVLAWRLRSFAWWLIKVSFWLGMIGIIIYAVCSNPSGAFWALCGLVVFNLVSRHFKNQRAIVDALRNKESGGDYY